MSEKKKPTNAPQYPPVGDPPLHAIPQNDPPVPNRAWTEMRLGKDIDAMSEEEKAELYLGRDRIL